MNRLSSTPLLGSSPVADGGGGTRSVTEGDRFRPRRPVPLALLLISLTLPACQSIHSDLQATAKNDILPPQDTVGGDV